MSHIQPGTHEFGLSEPVMVILDADLGLEEKAFISRLEMVDGQIIGYWVVFVGGSGGVEILINASYAHEQLKHLPSETRKVKATPTHDLNFLRERAAARNVKRGLINASRIDRHYRRLMRITEWTLTELGKQMLGKDDSDDYPRWNDYPVLSPTGNPVAELEY